MTSSITLEMDDLLTLRFATTSSENPMAVSRGSTHGPFSSKYRGQGLDFDDLRHYVPGDDVRHIDWKVSARYQKTMTRLFREERDSTITLAVDARAVMYTGTQSLRAVSAGHLAAALAWHAVQRSHRIGALVLTDSEIFTASPQAGEKGALQVCRTLCDGFDHQANNTASISSSQAINTLTTLIDAAVLGGRQLGSTVLLSGFDDYFNHDLSNELSDALAVIQAKHQRHSHKLCAIQVLDTADVTALPPGRYGYRQSATSFIGSNKKSRTLKLHATQRDALQNQLNKQISNVEALCERQAIHNLQHAGPATETSIKKLIKNLTAGGLFV